MSITTDACGKTVEEHNETEETKLMSEATDGCQERTYECNMSETTNMSSPPNGSQDMIQQHNNTAAVDNTSPLTTGSPTETTNMSSATNGCEDMTEEHIAIATATTNAHLITSSPTDELKCCPGCTLKVTVTSIDDIKTGDHICYRPSWYSPYRHHAIVENVNKDKEELDCIHLTRRDGSVSRSFFGKKFEIKKTSDKVTEMHKLEVVKYPYGRYRPEKTIDNATNEMKKRGTVTYNICTYNCEHFCYQNTIRYKSSKQAESCFRICGLSAQSLSIIFAWLFRYFAKFIIIPIIDINPEIAERIAIALFTFVSILLLLYCILKCSPCCKNEKEACKICCPKRCDACIKRHNYVRWIRFLSFVCLQLPSLFLEIYFIRKENRQAAVLLTGLAFLFVTLFTISQVPKAVRFCLSKGYKFSSVSNV